MTGPRTRRALVVGASSEIGRAVAVRLEALGCEIHYHNRRPATGSGYAYHGSAAELAAAVDVLVVAVPGGPDSAGTVGAEVLDALGPDGAGEQHREREEGRGAEDVVLTVADHDHAPGRVERRERHLHILGDVFEWNWR